MSFNCNKCKKNYTMKMIYNDTVGNLNILKQNVLKHAFFLDTLITKLISNTT
jgi:hypothetical protein